MFFQAKTQAEIVLLNRAPDSVRQTHVEVIEHLVHHFHPVAHPLELHVQVDELGLVLAPLVAVRRREGLQLPCIELN